MSDACWELAIICSLSSISNKEESYGGKRQEYFWLIIVWIWIVISCCPVPYFRGKHFLEQSLCASGRLRSITGISRISLSLAFQIWQLNYLSLRLYSKATETQNLTWCFMEFVEQNAQQLAPFPVLLKQTLSISRACQLEGIDFSAVLRNNCGP